MSGQVVFWALASLALVGAVTVVATRDVMRLALGLGAFLLALAGLFALHGFGFLAMAEVFVYVGGVLVLVIFAIMLVHRSEPGRPALESRHDSLAAVAAVGVGAFVVMFARPLVPVDPFAATSGVGDLAELLLGPMLPQFELAGLLLLAALVAIVAINGGEER